MRKINRLEDSLNGGFSGLYGEVVTFDSYMIKQIDFTPHVVIDLGANVGVFSRFARELFPASLVVSVEPNPDNVAVFRRFTNDEKIILIEKAVGQGVMFRRIDQNALINGSHESYMPEKLLTNQKQLMKVEVEPVMLDELFNSYVKPTDKVLVKIDCEGSEFCLFEHEPSLKCLGQAEYFAFELHHEMEYYTEREKVEKRKVVSAFINRLSKTHSVIHDGVHLFGTKK